MAKIDYKDKYEKAVQAAMLAKHDTESAVTIGILEEIFPELRESEDERIRKEIIAHIKWCEDSGYCAKEEMTRWITFLERQGEQMPAAWSEEDEKIIQDIINDIAIAQEQVYCKSRCEDEINWLKSLKDRYTWKPSDEQMNTLKSACGGNYVKLGILESLYVDLKKLREE